MVMTALGADVSLSPERRREAFRERDPLLQPVGELDPRQALRIGE